MHNDHDELLIIWCTMIMLNCGWHVTQWSAAAHLHSHTLFICLSIRFYMICCMMIISCAPSLTCTRPHAAAFGSSLFWVPPLHLCILPAYSFYSLFIHLLPERTCRRLWLLLPHQPLSLTHTIPTKWYISSLHKFVSAHGMIKIEKSCLPCVCVCGFPLRLAELTPLASPPLPFHPTPTHPNSTLEALSSPHSSYRLMAWPNQTKCVFPLRLAGLTPLASPSLPAPRTHLSPTLEALSSPHSSYRLMAWPNQTKCVFPLRLAGLTHLASPSLPAPRTHLSPTLTCSSSSSSSSSIKGKRARGPTALVHLSQERASWRWAWAWVWWEASLPEGVWTELGAWSKVRVCMCVLCCAGGSLKRVWGNVCVCVYVCVVLCQRQFKESVGQCVCVCMCVLCCARGSLKRAWGNVCVCVCCVVPEAV